jgi:methyltransferase (TIGR00027 family)
MSDRTAAGVAKIRWTETLAEPAKRVCEDPLAHVFVGSSFLHCLGFGVNAWLDGMFCAGFYEMIVGRTRVLDEVVKAAIADGATQYIILGAGYDTRAYRLGLPSHVRIYEVDQEPVQSRKRSKLARATDLPPVDVIHVAVDLKFDSLHAALTNARGFDPAAKMVVTLEGVTQYIPKIATASTINTIDALCGPGSTLFLSYVDENTRDDPAKVCGKGYPNPASVQRIEKLVKMAGEPWVSYFGQAEVPKFLEECSRFALVSDTSMVEANEEFFAPVGRGLPERKLCCFERYVVAVKP